LLGIAVAFQALADQRLDQCMAVGVEGALLQQDLAEGRGLGDGPGVHGGDKGVTADQVGLQRQDAEEEVAVGRGRRRAGHGHGALLRAGVQQSPFPGICFAQYLASPQREQAFRSTPFPFPARKIG
jgi:hypothetical protein